jgi:hypothetical protein
MQYDLNQTRLEKQTMKKKKAYWILTGLLATWLALGAFFDLTQAVSAREIMHTLHYPDYVLLILGPCKLLAVPALLYRAGSRIGEWAYAGVTFDSYGAFTSHCAVHDGFVSTIAPIIMLALAAGSYLLRPGLQLGSRCPD